MCFRNCVQVPATWEGIGGSYEALLPLPWRATDFICIFVYQRRFLHRRPSKPSLHYKSVKQLDVIQLYQ